MVVAEQTPGCGRWSDRSGALFRVPEEGRRIGVDLDAHWDEESDSFHVNVEYDGVVTDVSAEFRIVETNGGFGIERTIIHVA